MGRLAPHDVFFSQSPGIPTRNARFIVICLSETLIDLRTTRDRTFTRITKLGSWWARLSDVSLWHYSKEPSEASRWPTFGRSSRIQLCRVGAGAGGHSAWNRSHRDILCGAGIAFEAGISFRDWSQSRSKLCRFCINSRDAEPESKPQHIARGQNRSRSDILVNSHSTGDGAPADLAGAPAPVAAGALAKSKPEPQPQRILSRTPESEPELPKTPDLVTAGTYKIGETEASWCQG